MTNDDEQAQAAAAALEDTTVVRVGDLPAIVPEISGRAWITGRGEYLLEADDPFPAGFAL